MRNKGFNKCRETNDILVHHMSIALLQIYKENYPYASSPVTAVVNNSTRRTTFLKRETTISTNQ
jgi:hypothetical protein